MQSVAGKYDLTVFAGRDWVDRGLQTGYVGKQPVVHDADGQDAIIGIDGQVVAHTLILPA